MPYLNCGLACLSWVWNKLGGRARVRLMPTLVQREPLLPTHCEAEVRMLNPSSAFPFSCSQSTST